jgi:hypothetical protein
MEEEYRFDVRVLKRSDNWWEVQSLIPGTEDAVHSVSSWHLIPGLEEVVRRQAKSILSTRGTPTTRED